MGFLEVCVDMMNLAGTYDLASPAYQAFSFGYLLAALFLARQLRKPRK
jgi:hypothetical protein